MCVVLTDLLDDDSGQGRLGAGDTPPHSLDDTDLLQQSPDKEMFPKKTRARLRIGQYTLHDAMQLSQMFPKCPTFLNAYTRSLEIHVTCVHYLICCK